MEVLDMFETILVPGVIGAASLALQFRNNQPFAAK